MIRRVAVYCGASHGKHPHYAAMAARLGQELAQRGLELVYGGSEVGLMGVLANAALEQGGRVIGVIPESLVRRELAHRGLSELHEVASMHERKALMADLADAYIALPGGFGTLDELFEMLTWHQLRLHAKPGALLEVGGYYAHLVQFLDHARAEGFLRTRHRSLLPVFDDPVPLLDHFRHVPPVAVEPWNSSEQR